MYEKITDKKISFYVLTDKKVSDNIKITDKELSVNKKKVRNEKGSDNMRLSREKVNIAMARKKMTVASLAKTYGVSRARMNVILNSQTITPICAGKVSDALGVDVTEIIEQ